MTSSTDALSHHDYSTEDDTHSQDSSKNKLQTTPKRSQKSRSCSSHSSPTKMKVSVEAQEEIDNLQENVPPVEEAFTILNKIGSGTFSSVFAARIKNRPKLKQMYALKHIIPTSHPSRIENELRCLQQIGGVDNVMGVKACLRERDHVVIVMPFFHHDRFQDYVDDLGAGEIQDYMYNLLVALRRVHQVNIIHRDVKPSNFLINRKHKKYALVDFGLAQQAPVPTATGGHNEAIPAPGTSTRSSVRTSGEKPASEPITDVHSKTRSCKTEQESVAAQSKKRKLECAMDNENVPLSPRKKRLTSQGGLAEIDVNKQTGQEVNEMDCSKPPVQSLTKVAVTPPTKSLFNSTYKRTEKSPRRAVLTRNVKPWGVSKAGAPSEKRTTMIVQNSSGRAVYRSVMPSECQCFGRPLICSICMARSSQHAPRAGTPGFRAPEVLLKCPEQTTAVDMWSAGVIFLSLLSGRYPFFKAPDDLTATAQIMSVFGTEAVHKAALTYGKHVISHPRQPAIDLKFLCEKLSGAATAVPASQSKSSSDKENPTVSRRKTVSDTAYDLLSKLLDLNPATRISADMALKHPFFDVKG